MVYTLDVSSNNFSDLLDLAFLSAIVLWMMYLEKRSKDKRSSDLAKPFANQPRKHR